MHFLILMSLIYTPSVLANDGHIMRNLTTEVICNTSSPLFYTIANGTKDKLHYLSTTQGIPTIFIAKTDIEAKLSVDCKGLVNTTKNSIKFLNNKNQTYEAPYIYGLSLNKLFEYNDVNDTADLKKLDLNNTQWNVTDLQSSDIVWSSSFNNTLHTITWTIKTNCSELQLQDNGSLSFKFYQYGGNGEAEHLPHQQFNANITQIQLVLDNLFPKFSHSRYALELTMFSSDSKKQVRNEIKIHKSIDDEHTPGVFELVDVTVKGDDQINGAYLQWKPVCYTLEPASIKDSTLMKSYKLNNSIIETDVFNLAYAYFGSNVTNLNVISTNVSFGLSKDKFYALTNYTAWTFSLGYGSPPQESISLLIIMIISIGLGIPVLLIIFGGLCAFFRKYKDRDNKFSTTGYTQIQ